MYCLTLHIQGSSNIFQRKPIACSLSFFVNTLCKKSYKGVCNNLCYELVVSVNCSGDQSLFVLDLSVLEIKLMMIKQRYRKLLLRFVQLQKLISFDKHKFEKNYCECKKELLFRTFRIFCKPFENSKTSIFYHPFVPVYLSFSFNPLTAFFKIVFKINGFAIC